MDPRYRPAIRRSTTQGTGIEYANAQGNPTLFKSTGSVQAQVSLDYDTAPDGKPGRLISSTDPRGNTTRYGYDTAGNLTKIDHPAVTPTSVPTTSGAWRPSSGHRRSARSTATTASAT